jgi:hypothetical protein
MPDTQTDKHALYYTREITMPKTKREGLANFVQMVINAAEAGDSREAMLKAVDLLNDIHCGVYDDAMGVSQDHAQSALSKQLQCQAAEAGVHAAVEFERGRQQGAEDKARQIAEALGVPAERIH